MTTSRRHFLRTASGLAAAVGPLHTHLASPFALSLAGLGAMASQSASAADTSGYRALVCLFMNGGNDAHNWVVPIDATGHAQYTAVRRELAWPLARLQGITSTTQGSGRSFGMPQELAPLRSWYEAGRAAVLANVGPLVRPITKAEYLAGTALPSKLFSHNDQQSTWQSLSPEGALSGWGGRMGDLLMSANSQPVFTAVSSAGNAVFLSGNSVTQYQVSVDGPVGVNHLTRGWGLESNSASPVLRTVLQTSGSNVFQSEYARVMRRSLETAATLRTALSSTAVPALPTSAIALPSGGTLNLSQDDLARQLRIVAQMIGAGPAMGMRRQVFMVSIGGFDTHAFQWRDQPLLMSRVAHSVDWFLRTLQGIGLFDNTLLFTASDFGRTLTSNGAGSDHGWGSHHFVAGGAVRGRTIYGSFPVTALGTATDAGSGRLLPTTSVTQYAATMGRWMGLTSSELATVLPDLGNYSNTALGFV
ncbi:uncharacterized protein (DUF1501 family) [Sphaerotilus hippei]|uniref:Uncharacterized protein (DUF1501 family) n=1 Tax=Sphaerotilus hippei TaxID=744406 RepID=A0A318H3G7_9BURK|nr:DUF1501 domain-containing protein [Sphaerotilus hippei]PXW97964.1 uncharacterized protein (DUF1501 family) [Sphaerotilus hippei]